MANEIVESTVQRAVRQAYADWSVEHPNLAAVIDQIVITERSSERLRETDEYTQAVAAFHDSRNELDLFNRLLSLAGPIIQQLLG